MAPSKTSNKTESNTNRVVSPSTHARFLRSSSASLQALQSLPQACMVVLFTPAMPPLHHSGSKIKGAAKPEPEDPFECFGQALSKRHARVRHVPFVPRIGFADVHLPWIRQAHGIVVVACEPPGETSGRRRDSMHNQERFMAAVASALLTMRPTDGSLVTMNAVYCGTSQAPLHPGYQNVVQCQSYTQRDLEGAARLLMGR